jgi:hypothetical protein
VDASRRGRMDGITSESISKLRLPGSLTRLLQEGGYPTSVTLVELSWRLALPLDEALSNTFGDKITARDCIKVKDRLTAYLSSNRPKKVAGESECRICHCTDSYCAQCIVRTGNQCDWVERDLCGACHDHARLNCRQRENSK